MLSVMVHNQKLDISKCKALPLNLSMLLHLVKVCPGNPDIRFMDMATARKGFL